MCVLMNGKESGTLQAASLASLVRPPRFQAWFWTTEEARLFSWVLGGAGTYQLITGCLPHPYYPYYVLANVFLLPGDL